MKLDRQRRQHLWPGKKQELCLQGRGGMSSVFFYSVSHLEVSGGQTQERRRRSMLIDFPGRVILHWEWLGRITSCQAEHTVCLPQTKYSRAGSGPVGWSNLHWSKRFIYLFPHFPKALLVAVELDLWHRARHTSCRCLLTHLYNVQGWTCWFPRSLPALNVHKLESAFWEDKFLHLFTPIW